MDEKTSAYINPDIHPLDELLDLERRAAQEFSKERPSFWGLAQNALTAARMLISIAMKVHSTKSEACRLILWQTVLEYQRHALQAIIIGELGIGYTLLRNATELSRDIAGIKTDYDSDRWFQSRKDNKRDGYFKFDKSDPTQAYVYSVYKEASDLGTHGHFSVIRFGEITGHANQGDKELALVQISDEGKDQAMHLWLASFAPIHVLCGSQFRAVHPDEFTFGWSLFLKWNNQAHHFLEGLRSENEFHGA